MIEGAVFVSRDSLINAPVTEGRKVIVLQWLSRISSNTFFSQSVSGCATDNFVKLYLKINSERLF